MFKPHVRRTSSLFKWLRLPVRLVLSVVVALAWSVLSGHVGPAGAQSPPPDKAKIGPGVIEALRAEGEAMVIVALVAPPSLQARQINLPRLRQGVSTLQNGALSVLNAGEFRTKYKYSTVPALAGTLSSEAGLLKLAAHPNVARIDLDMGGKGDLANSVPLIGADIWHGGGITGDGVVVAVLDSGLDTDHSDLAGALIDQECFLDNDGAIDGRGLCPNGSDRQSGPGAAEDDAGHGTHVTGIVASRGNRSSVGVAPGAKIVAIKVTAGPSSSGTFYYFSEIVAALDFIINNRPDVKIINMSLVTYATYEGDCDNANAGNMAGAAAINTLRAGGVIAFSSSGNSGLGSRMSAPACLSNVIAVGATDNADSIASFTNSDSSTDIMAPGVNITSSYLSNGVIAASGTSMASPHAAGCAALLVQSGAAVTPDQIESVMESSPVRVTDPKNGLTFPRLDCRPRPPEGVVVEGPVAGGVGASYSFTATAGPITATLPLTYVWQVSGQPPITRTGGLSDTLVFAWATPGMWAITVTAENMAGVVSDTHAILIDSVPPEGVVVEGPVAGGVGASYSFTATVSPIMVTLPLTYVWQASGQPPITRTGGLSDTLAFAWGTPGVQVITVTAMNVVAVTGTHSLSIDQMVYLPLVLR
jgi:subtilisin family serine protease